MTSEDAVFWLVAPCSLVEVYQRFRGPCCLHHQGDRPSAKYLSDFCGMCSNLALIIVLMMEAARTSETLVNFYQTTLRYNPEDSHIRTHRRENLKSYITTSHRNYHPCIQTIQAHMMPIIDNYQHREGKQRGMKVGTEFYSIKATTIRKWTDTN
jgi:hypothetical protein